MIVDKVVTRCYRSCPFFEAGMDYMACAHPIFNKHPSGGMFITHENSHDRVPDECPLGEHPVTNIIRLSNN